MCEYVRLLLFPHLKKGTRVLFLLSNQCVYIGLEHIKTEVSSIFRYNDVSGMPRKCHNNPLAYFQEKVVYLGYFWGSRQVS